jgi:hypothetical protein
MLELCSQGIFFTCSFLERLPAELRITLREYDHQNMLTLAKKADALWSLHGMKTSFSASLVNVEEPSKVAAVSFHGSGCCYRFNCHGGLGGHSGQPGASRDEGQ